MAICPKCNAEQPEGLNFCTKCGAQLTPSVTTKKSGAAKGLIFGGCGCIALIAIVIGIIIVIAFLMTGMRGRAPGPRPQPPITQPQQPAMPTQPVGPQPTMPVQPQVPQQPVMPPQPTAPTPSPYEYYKVKEGEIVIVFAKGLTQEGLPTETTRKFSSNDPQVVEIICWGPNTLAAGTNLTSVWYYNNNAVYNNYYKVEENKFIAIDVIQRPASGFPPGEYTVYVGVNDTPVLSHSFTVQ